MKKSILVDGYNLIHASSDLTKSASSFGIERARADLIQALGKYSVRHGCECIVVFDGVVEPAPSVSGVRVLFSGTRPADNVIRDQVHKAGQGLMVVSSDREVVSNARLNHASTQSSAGFAAELSLILNEKQDEDFRSNLRPHRLDELREPSEKPDITDDEIDEWKKFFGED